MQRLLVEGGQARYRFLQAGLVGGVLSCGVRWSTLIHSPQG